MKLYLSSLNFSFSRMGPYFDSCRLLESEHLISCFLSLHVIEDLDFFFSFHRLNELLAWLREQF